jgi:hypothetical protein
MVKVIHNSKLFISLWGGVFSDMPVVQITLTVGVQVIIIRKTYIVVSHRDIIHQ